MYFLMVFIIITLGIVIDPTLFSQTSAEMSLRMTVTEIFYLNKALALFNTGTSLVLQRTTRRSPIILSNL